jgi:hypothetical protein
MTIRENSEICGMKKQLLALAVVISLTSCTIQKIYTDGKVVQDSTKVKVGKYEIRKVK